MSDEYSAPIMSNAQSQSGSIEIEEEGSKVTGKFLALVICVPLAIILVICFAVVFSICVKKKDKKNHVTSNFGDKKTIYNSIDDAQCTKEYDFGFGPI